jgi:DNA-binding NtrC family response regulator
MPQQSVQQALAVSPKAFPTFLSKQYKEAVSQLERIAAARSIPILIEGETGTGKSRIARHLHRCSPRAAGPFVELSLSAIAENVADSELFGHEVGAFTDAKTRRAGIIRSASGGTVFLDELGKATPSVQSKLLHLFDHHRIRPVGADREVVIDTRVFAATNVSLERLVQKDRFLPDLYARLEMFRVELPPLRKRREDIPLLIDYFLVLHSSEHRYAEVPSMSQELIDVLTNAEWPTNIRGLEGMIHCLLLQAAGAKRLTSTILYPSLAQASNDEFAHSRRAQVQRRGDCARARAEQRQQVAGRCAVGRLAYNYLSPVEWTRSESTR